MSFWEKMCFDAKSLYEAAGLAGYFFPMLLFVVLAIFSAKSWVGWVMFANGVFWQLLELIGTQKTAEPLFIDMKLCWVIYFALLIASAIIIEKRYRKANAVQQQNNKLPT